MSLYILLGGGCWLLFVVLYTTPAENFISKLLFHIIPTFLGIAIIFISSKMIGWL